MSGFARVPVLALERDPQRELNGTREIGLLTDLAEPRRREIGVRQSELSMVEQVENLSAELHSGVLRKIEVLAGRKVPVFLAFRPQSRIHPALIPEGKGTRLSKARRVEPFAGPLVAVRRPGELPLAAGDKIWPNRAGAELAQIVARCLHRNRQTAAECRNAVHAPSADDGVFVSIDTAKEHLAVSDRHIEAIVHYKNIGDILEAERFLGF